jgi:hypothetical protein
MRGCERMSGLLPSLGTRFLLASLPRTAVPGSPLPPIRGWGRDRAGILATNSTTAGIVLRIIHREGR